LLASLDFLSLLTLLGDLPEETDVDLALGDEDVLFLLLNFGDGVELSLEAGPE
jgi:hypothetical protein